MPTTHHEIKRLSVNALEYYIWEKTHTHKTNTTLHVQALGRVYPAVEGLWAMIYQRITYNRTKYKIATLSAFTTRRPLMSSFFHNDTREAMML